MYTMVLHRSSSFMAQKVTCKPLYFVRSVSFTSPFCDNVKGSSKRKLTHYQILEIKKNASSEDIRNAFLRLSKENHPDMNSNDPQNHAKFVDINEAYSVLSKPLLRREYDNELLYRLKSLKPNPNSSHPYDPTHSYQESQFYDPQFYANRDKSQDAYYASRPYYGIKGIPKLSNNTVVSICLIVIVVGAAFHFFVVKKLSDIHIANLNAHDKRAAQIWKNANDPDNNSELIRLMKEKDMERRNKDN